MATPATMVDGTTPLNAANLNKYLASDGTKIQVKVYHARIRYNGSSFVVESANDSAGIVTANLTFVGGSTTLEIAISGFTNPPSVQVTPNLINTAYNVKAKGTSNVKVEVGFYAIANGARITTGTGDTNMDFHILIIGF